MAQTTPTKPTHPASTFPRITGGATLVGGICWILTLEFFVGQAIAQAAWRTPYSLATNYISDLGATACQTERLATYHAYVCSPLHVVMNASFVVTGLLYIAGMYLTRGAWPRRRLTTWGIVFITLAGLGKVLVGFAPENLYIGLHTLGSLGIVFGNIGLILLGLAIGRARPWAAALALGLGILGLLGFILLVAAPIGVGTAERIADYPIVVWMVALGVAFVVWARKPDPLT